MNELTLCRCGLAVALLLWACLAAGAEAAPGGALKAQRVLFLGNSITLHGPHEPYGWRHNCGMAASVPEKDYVHVLAAALTARTGCALRLSPTAGPAGPDGVAPPATIVNIADIFERHYAPFDSARLQAQLAWKPDLVIVQCGENVVRETFDPAAFKTGFQALLAALQAAGNPQVFVTGQVLGDGGPLDQIKREVCAEDPAHRSYVDLSSFHGDATNLASAEPYYSGIIVGHPGDKGMALIAALLLKAIVARSEQTPAP